MRNTVHGNYRLFDMMASEEEGQCLDFLVECGNLAQNFLKYIQASDNCLVKICMLKFYIAEPAEEDVTTLNNF